MPRPTSRRARRGGGSGPRGFPWTDYLLARTALDQDDPAFRDLGLRLLQALRKHAAEAPGPPDAGPAARDIAAAKARRAGSPAVADRADGGLALWHPSSLVPSYFLGGGSTPPRWAAHQGHVAHIAGPGNDYLLFDYPLTGTFELSLDAYSGSWAEANSRLWRPVRRAVLDGQWRRDLPDRRHGDDQPALAVHPLRRLQPVHGPGHARQGPLRRQRPPLLRGRRPQPDQSLAGAVHASRAPYGLAQPGDPRRADDPARRSGSATRTGSRAGSPASTTSRSRHAGRSRAPTSTAMPPGSRSHPHAPGRSSAVIRAHARRSRRIRLVLDRRRDPGPPHARRHRPGLPVAAGKTPPPARAGSTTTARSATATSSTYEFLYEPDQVMVHPALDRLAFLLEPDGVRLHWMTVGTQRPLRPAGRQRRRRAGRIAAARRSLPSSRASGTRCKSGAERRSDHASASTARRSTSASWSRRTAGQFGLYHDKERTSVQVRNVELRGRWPEAIPAAERADLAALRPSEPNGRGRPPRPARDDRRELLQPRGRRGPRPGPRAASPRIGIASSPTGSCRAPIIPASGSAAISRPAIPPRHCSPRPASGRTRSGASRRPASNPAARSAPRPSSWSTRPRPWAGPGSTSWPSGSRRPRPRTTSTAAAGWRCIALIAMARGEDDKAAASLEQLKPLLEKRPADQPEGASWPELTLTARAIERPRLRPAALALLDMMVDQAQKKSPRWLWEHQVKNVRRGPGCSISSDPAALRSARTPISARGRGSRTGGPTPAASASRSRSGSSATGSSPITLATPTT